MPSSPGDPFVQWKPPGFSSASPEGGGGSCPCLGAALFSKPLPVTDETVQPSSGLGPRLVRGVQPRCVVTGGLVVAPGLLGLLQGRCFARRKWGGFSPWIWLVLWGSASAEFSLSGLWALGDLCGNKASS